jgi:hypothetical protein
MMQDGSARRSTMDLPLEAAHARIGELRSAAISAGAGGPAVSAAVARMRAGLGRWVIAIGSALAPDEPVRRPALRS